MFFSAGVIVIVIYPKQKSIAAITLSINGKDIENVEHFNFLGISLYWMKSCLGKITLICYQTKSQKF